MYRITVHPNQTHIDRASIVMLRNKNWKRIDGNNNTYQNERNNSVGGGGTRIHSGIRKRSTLMVTYTQKELCDQSELAVLLSMLTKGHCTAKWGQRNALFIGAYEQLAIDLYQSDTNNRSSLIT